MEAVDESFSQVCSQFKARVAELEDELQLKKAECSSLKHTLQAKENALQNAESNRDDVYRRLTLLEKKYSE